MRNLSLSLLLLASLAPAQTLVTVPNIGALINVDRPFPGGVGRYQQWFSAASLQAAILEPMRFNRVEFFAGSQPTTQACQINCEILLGHGKASGLSGTFDNNWDSPPTMVKPLGQVQLNAGALGAVVMSIPFANKFTWDRTRPVVMEIRIHGNSLSNQPFSYNFRGSTISVGTTNRVYIAGNAFAPIGTVQNGAGMIARFTAQPGITLPFGSGCPGEGGVVPVQEVLQIPAPGTTWSHRLSSAPSQRFAFWVIGDSVGSPLPVDLSVLFGLPASGCLLYTNVGNAVATTTVGGGAGAGIATLDVPLPATTNYLGMSLYTQWVVFDPLSPNGLLCVTPATWSIVAL